MLGQVAAKIQNIRASFKSENGSTASTDTGGEVRGAAIKNAELQAGWEGSRGVLLSSARRRCVRWRDVVTTDTAIGKKPEQGLRRKRCQRVAEAFDARAGEAPGGNRNVRLVSCRARK